MNRTCYIVDDEQHAIDSLARFIAETPGLELAGSALDPRDALRHITEEAAPDITFLDIDMPQLSGLELATLINGQTTVIFTTAYREYALDAFDRQALDYLLKPVSYARFLACIQKIRKLKPEQDASAFLIVKTGLKNQFLRLPVVDIVYISAALNHIEIYLKERRVVTYLSLAAVSEQLSPARFSRVHKSFIVNHDYVQLLEYGQLTLTGKQHIPIGRAYRKSFHQKMKASFTTGRYPD